MSAGPTDAELLVAIGNIVHQNVTAAILETILWGAYRFDHTRFTADQKALALHTTFAVAAMVSL
jgi:hypothetical protein